MTWTAGRDSGRRRRTSDERLDRFEAAWKGGSPPDIREYLTSADASDTEYLKQLVKLDLSYRWMRYRQSDSKTALDEHGFSTFPRLEDYAALADDATGIFTLELIAEEYRIRNKWGDRPDRSTYLSRFPDAEIDLQAELSRVDTELADESLPKSTVQYSGGDSKSPASSFIGDPRLPEALGRYQLKSRIGRGGFGEVWKAYDPTLERSVAIKVLRPDKEFPPRVIDDFEKEGRKLARLESIPGIVRIHDAGTSEGCCYIVSELIAGESLDKRLKRSPLSFAEVVQIVSEVAESLHKVHLKDLVHRDVKPANILLREDGSPVLVDFGLAVTETEQLWEPQAVIGTFKYMSPEQVDGKGHQANAQTDIYSLGVVLYRLLTGRLPYVGKTYTDWREQITSRPPRAPRTINDKIPAQLERICLKCLEKRPEDRYSTARDLAKDLRDALEQPRFRVPVFAAAAIAGLVLIALSIAAFFDLGTDQTTDEPLPPAAAAESPEPANEAGNIEEPRLVRGPQPGFPANAIPRIRPRLTSENLLDQAPEPIVWDDGFPINDFHLGMDKRFTVRSRGTAVFLLGKHESNHFLFRIRIHVENGVEVGLIWGYGKKEIPGGTSLTQAHAVLADLRGQGVVLRLSELTFSNLHSKGVQRTATIAPIEFDPAPADVFDIELEVEKGKIESLKIHDDLIPVQAPNPVFQQGGLGLYVSGGYFVITEAWYLNLENDNNAEDENREKANAQEKGREKANAQEEGRESSEAPTP